ncbi:hypothetical protein [Paraburkholderia sp. RL17-337-BIB-A]|uniref:hypothetical protein n=1 Tax=Paraburkholderia sp. RL17-337-BIB-A TaxID=3031636 RepID=UPI0038B88558
MTNQLTTVIYAGALVNGARLPDRRRVPALSQLVTAATSADHCTALIQILRTFVQGCVDAVPVVSESADICRWRPPPRLPPLGETELAGAGGGG